MIDLPCRVNAGVVSTPKDKQTNKKRERDAQTHRHTDREKERGGERGGGVTYEKKEKKDSVCWWAVPCAYQWDMLSRVQPFKRRVVCSKEYSDKCSRTGSTQRKKKKKTARRSY